MVSWPQQKEGPGSPGAEDRARLPQRRHCPWGGRPDRVGVRVGSAPWTGGGRRRRRRAPPTVLPSATGRVYCDRPCVCPSDEGIRGLAHGTVGFSGLQVPETPHGLAEPWAPPGSEQAPREAGGEARGPMFCCPHFWGGRKAVSWEELSISANSHYLKKEPRKKNIPFALNLRRALLEKRELSCNYFCAPGHRYKYSKEAPQKVRTVPRLWGPPGSSRPHPVSPSLEETPMGVGVLPPPRPAAGHGLPPPPSLGEPAWETRPEQLADTLSLFGLFPYEMVPQESSRRAWARQCFK